MGGTPEVRDEVKIAGRTNPRKLGRSNVQRRVVHAVWLDHEEWLGASEGSQIIDAAVIHIKNASPAPQSRAPF